MGLTVFNQFPQLTRLLACIARVAAHKETARSFDRINLSGGRGSLTDRAVNLVAFDGAAATLACPNSSLASLGTSSFVSKSRRKRPSPSRAMKLDTHLVKMKDGVMYMSFGDERYVHYGGWCLLFLKIVTILVVSAVKN